MNAGSMADIAFLLLIFFLVTTTIETDAGLARMLPRKQKEPPIIDYQKKNILQVVLDKEGRLMVDEELINLKDLREKVSQFVDNGGAPSQEENHCSYCKGKADPTSSDNPKKAVIAVNTHRETSYGAYITVQNELVAAYNQLRDREAQIRYKTSYTAMEEAYQKPETSSKEKKALKQKIQHIRLLYPLNILEPQQL